MLLKKNIPVFIAIIFVLALMCANVSLATSIPTTKDFMFNAGLSQNVSIYGSGGGVFNVYQQGTFISLHYLTGVMNVSAGSLIYPNGYAYCGQTIRFKFQPFVSGISSSISWAASGGYYDTPNGVWGTGSPTSNCDSSYLVATLSPSQYCAGTSFNIYFPLVVNPPAPSFVAPSGLDCGGVTPDNDGGYYVDCNVTAHGISLNPVFNYSSTYGHFYIQQYNTNTVVNNYCNVVQGCSVMTAPVGTVNVPAQSFSYPLTARSVSATLNASQSSVYSGQAFTLSWDTDGATCTTNWGGGSVNGQGSTTRTITSATTFTLNCDCGTGDSTTVNVRVDGQCNSAINGHNFRTLNYSPSLCSVGTPQNFNLSGNTWLWSCTSQNGGIIPKCSANRITDGECGTANNHTYPAGSSGFESFTLCSAGNGQTNPSIVNFPTATNANVSWTCLGAFGGSQSPVCNAHLTVNGTCGSNGTTSGITYGSGTVNWPTLGTFCGVGSGAVSPLSPLFPTTSYPASTTWVCAGGANGGIASGTCIARLLVNGQCDTVAEQHGTNAPAGNLCARGSASSVSGFGPWTWTCSGYNGGTTEPCLKPLDGSCGDENGKIYPRDAVDYATNNFCSTGYVSPYALVPSP